MVDAHVAFTTLQDSSEAGTYLGARIEQAFDGAPADAAIVFASTRHELEKLVEAFHARCKPSIIIGCSSAGEFISNMQAEGAAAVLALRSSEILFAPAIGRDLRKSRSEAAQQIARSLSKSDDEEYPYRSMLLLTDALAGYADEFLECLSLETAGRYQMFGGGAADELKYVATYVFYGTEIVTDAAVALEMRSKKPIGVGVNHGWKIASAPMRVTAADGNRILSLDAVPATAMLSQYAKRTGQNLDLTNPMPFFLHNALAIDTQGGHKIRVPIMVQDDGSIVVAGEIADGSTVHVVTTTARTTLEATVAALRTARDQLGGCKPKIALLFDCVSTRLRSGQEYSVEFQDLQNELGPEVKYIGFSTYGQFARVDGQFSGFHNSTAVVCIIPE